MRWVNSSGLIPVLEDSPRVVVLHFVVVPHGDRRDPGVQVLQVRIGLEQRIPQPVLETTPIDKESASTPSAGRVRKRPTGLVCFPARTR